MTALTSNEQAILDALRAGEETGDIEDGFGHVYLDNVIDTSDKSVRGTLGSLEKKGYYYPVDGYAWGAVKLAKSDENEAATNAAYDAMVNPGEPHKYTVKYYDDQLNLHIERIRSFKPLDKIESTYYSNFDVESVEAGW